MNRIPDEYYHTLGIPPGSDISVVKKAFRSLAMKYHPDRNPGKEAAEKFIKINEAYEIIIGERKAPLRRIINKANPFSHHKPSSGTTTNKSTSQSGKDRAFSERQNRRPSAHENARKKAEMEEKAYQIFKESFRAYRKSFVFKTIALVILFWFGMGLTMLIDSRLPGTPVASNYNGIDYINGELSIKLNEHVLYLSDKDHLHLIQQGKLYIDESPIFKQPRGFFTDKDLSADGYIPNTNYPHHIMIYWLLSALIVLNRRPFPAFKLIYTLISVVFTVSGVYYFLNYL
jgi:curved DNA-binding protein CbpA